MYGEINFNEPTAVIDPAQTAAIDVDRVATELDSSQISSYGEPEVGKKKKNRSVSDDFEVNLGKV